MPLSSKKMFYDCRKCSLATSTCTSDSLRNDNNTVYENVASNEQPRRADEEIYTELMF